MSRSRSVAAALYPALAGALLLLAVVTGEPPLIALAAPFLVTSAVAAAIPPASRLRASATLSRDRAVEGDVLELTVHVPPQPRLAWVSVAPAWPDGLEGDAGRSAVVLRVDPVVGATAAFAMCVLRWGAYSRIAVEVSGRDLLGTWRTSTTVSTEDVLRVHPTTSRLRGLVPPRRTSAGVGAHVSRERGAGMELAELRPFVTGDPLRAVNWRASARRGELYVTDRHPERSSDLVMFLDTFGPAGADRDATLGLAVEAVAALTERHLSTGDRVGLIDLGGVLRWIPPALGARALHQITESLLTSAIVETFAEKGVEVLPTHAFPAGAIVLAFTPLADRRTVATLLDLHSRGFDVAIVECRTEADHRSSPARDHVADLARRLWALERDSVREQLRHLGVVVVPWTRGQPLASALDQVVALRRRPHRAVTA